MSARKLNFHSGAIRDAREARSWYGQVDVSLADRFTTELWRTIGVAPGAPLCRAPDQVGKRHFRLQGFPYVLIYHWEEPVLRILAVAHTSRDPEHWRTRT